MDPFQREVIERLARIETKAETFAGLGDRVTTLERGEGRRNSLVAFVVALPAALGALWVMLRGAITS